MAPKTKKGKGLDAKTAKRKANPRYDEDKDPEEVKDISRGLDQGVDKEEGAECDCAENQDEMKRVKRASVSNKEEEEETEDEEKDEYGEGGIYEEGKGEDEDY
jgi:hypothetical protein